MALYLFDLDRTLLQTNISYEFGKHLRQQGHLSLQESIFLGAVYASHCFGMVSLQSLHKRVFATLFHKKPKQEFSILAHHFCKEVLDKFICPFCQEELQTAQKKEKNVAIFSSSPDFLVEPMAQLLGVRYFQGTEYQLDRKGCFSKVGTVITGEEKKNATKALMARLKVDQKKTYAYSDSILDLPFLQAAAHVTAVRPDRQLWKEAKKNGWRIIE